MKKYWPVLSLVMISIIGLSFYYIDMARANQSHIVFEFETLEGDDKYLDSLMFETGYYENNTYKDYYVEKAKSERVNNNSHYYFESNYELLSLFKEQKNFFRAKRLDGRHYFNNEKTLAYVYTDDQYHYDNPNKVLYKVDLLDKENNERQAVDIKVDIVDDFLWQTVEWVNVVDNELQTLSIREYHGSESIILTTFDLEKATATEKVLLSKEDSQVQIHHYNISYNTKPIAILRFYNNDTSEGISTETFYQFANGELREITLPNKNEFAFSSYDFTEKNLVAAMQQDEKMLIQYYNLETSNWEQSYNIPLVLQNSEGTPKVQLLDDKLYVLYPVDKGYVIEIVENKTGNKLYVGLMTAKNVDRKYNLTVNRVYNIK